MRGRALLTTLLRTGDDTTYDRKIQGSNNQIRGENGRGMERKKYFKNEVISIETTGWPTDRKTDRNEKNRVLLSKHVWFGDRCRCGAVRAGSTC
jgi:hypothetical protein